MTIRFTNVRTLSLDTLRLANYISLADVTGSSYIASPEGESMRITKGLTAALVAMLALGACGSVGDDQGDSGGDGGKLKVGLVIPQSGVYAPLGEDMKAGWDLYLSQHDGKLGGRTVETVVADEGEGPDTGVPAVQKFLRDTDVDVLVGIVNSATALGVIDAVDEAKKVLLVANAGASPITGSSPYIWRTSFTNVQVAYAMGEYLAGTPEGKQGAYAMAPDYAAGAEAIQGFKQGFTAAGGKVVGEAKTPFGTTQDFQPYLAKVRASGAGATYAFYSGAEAVAFVKQYKEFGLSRSIPLFGSGFLTEGGVLKAHGNSAVGIRTSLMYATALDNPANQKFAADYQEAAGRPATTFAVQTWDAALVLDQALAEAGGTGGDALGKALGALGPVADSPRGEWSFERQSPKQTIYLREVVAKGGNIDNEIVEPLGVFGPEPG
jgi:branched-chain amino acid transport system substrate-binding protein